MDIKNYHPVHDSQAKARDFWIFSYQCKGINFKDNASLKYKQLGWESITFIRAKTERTTRHALKPIVAMRTPEINRYIKRAAAYVGIEHNVTTYTARHTFSTVLKRAGAPNEFISESPGHSNLKTTEFYLDSLEDDVKRQHAAHLTAFSK